MSQVSTKTAHPLISSDRVEGTDVYNTQGEKLGHIDCVMLDKKKGNVAYAIMSFGGFLGMGEDYHPLPWQSLDYHEDKDGYVVNLSKEQLQGAPTLKRNQYNRLDDDGYGRNIYSYYDVVPYWY